MTTTILFVRHATCDPVGKSLAGRAPGVHLNAAGRSQARHLAERLDGVPLAAVYSSPLERARETAAPLAERAGLAVRTDDALTELDVGEWTGQTFGELSDGAHADLWRRFNSFRSGTRPPGGELAAEVQARAVAWMVAAAARHQDAVIAAVSHADVIKAALMSVVGMPLDFIHRIEVSPASVSVVAFSPDGARLVRLNECGGPLHL